MNRKNQYFVLIPTLKVNKQMEFEAYFCFAVTHFSLLFEYNGLKYIFPVSFQMFTQIDNEKRLFPIGIWNKHLIVKTFISDNDELDRCRRQHAQRHEIPHAPPPPLQVL